MSETQARVVRHNEREWVDFDIPDSAPAVKVARLQRDDETRSSTLLVRFPPGWSRPAAGSYTSSEEFFVLEGDLAIGDTEYGPGDYAYVPAGAMRGSSSSSGGALTLARFEGPARWRPK